MFSMSPQDSHLLVLEFYKNITIFKKLNSVVFSKLKNWRLYKNELPLREYFYQFFSNHSFVSSSDYIKIFCLTKGKSD